jgi:hypothetical protein
VPPATFLKNVHGDEFSPAPEIAARIKKYGALRSTLHVDVHEVIGHASGRLNPGITNVVIDYPDDSVTQRLESGEKDSMLPIHNE